MNGEKMNGKKMNGKKMNGEKMNGEKTNDEKTNSEKISSVKTNIGFGNLQKSFQTPPMFFRGTDLWMLNSKLEDAELERQIREMSDKGFYSFIARTYIGLQSDYPGPEFMSHMQTIVNAARKYNMKVFLQALYMPEAVLNLPSEYSLCNIRLFQSGDEIPSDSEVLTKTEHITYCSVPTHTFLDMTGDVAVALYLKKSYEEPWAFLEGEYGKTIISVWVDEPSYNADALPWSKSIEEDFQSRWGYSIRPYIPLLFTDGEDCRKIRYHYWISVQQRLKSAYFTQVKDWCNRHHLMASGHLMCEDTMESQLKRACCTMPYYRYFDMPGIDMLTVSMPWRENPLPPKIFHSSPQNSMINTPLQCVSAAHQAGKEHILCEMYGVSSQGLNFRDQKNMFDHFASLGINHRCIHALFYGLNGRGKRAYPPHINYYQPYWEDYRLVTDYCARTSWFISQGNPVRDLLVIHPMDSAFCEYHGPSAFSDANTVLHKLDISFHSLLVHLLGRQMLFELGDEDLIAEEGGIDSEGCFVIGSMKYRTVLLPSLVNIRKTTLNRLWEFSSKGGRIIVYGSLPELVDGCLVGPSDLRLFEQMNLSHADDITKLQELLSQGQTPFRWTSYSDSTDIQINYRVDSAGTEWILLFNRDCRKHRDGELSFAGKKQLWKWDAFHGSIQGMQATYTEDSDQTSLSLHLEAGGSILLTASLDTKLSSTASLDTEDALDRGYELRKSGCMLGYRQSVAFTITPPWNISRTEPNVLLLEFCKYRKSEEEYSDLMPILAVHEVLVGEDYHGPLQLQFPFYNASYEGTLKLAMENPERYSIALNGAPVSDLVSGHYFAKGFQVLTLPEKCRIGENLIECKLDHSPLTKARSGITSLFENLPGVELESMYLLGDFSVKTVSEQTNTNCVRLNRRMELVEESHIASCELTADGYPFYAGTMVFEQTFFVEDSIPLESYSTASLEIAGFRGCIAQLTFNGHDCGRTCFSPYSFHITGYLQKGENKITIRLTNTLRNLLGPYHRPIGEIGECWPGYKTPNSPWLGVSQQYSEEQNKNWYKNREPDTDSWTESYLQASWGFDVLHIYLEV